MREHCVSVCPGAVEESSVLCSLFTARSRTLTRHRRPSVPPPVSCSLTEHHPRSLATPWKAPHERTSRQRIRATTRSRSLGAPGTGIRRCPALHASWHTPRASTRPRPFVAPSWRCRRQHASPRGHAALRTECTAARTGRERVDGRGGGCSHCLRGATGAHGTRCSACGSDEVGNLVAHEHLVLDVHPR